MGFQNFRGKWVYIGFSVTLPGVLRGHYWPKSDMASRAGAPTRSLARWGRRGFAGYGIGLDFASGPHGGRRCEAIFGIIVYQESKIQ